MYLSNILLAPNSFKGSITTFEICRILQEELTGRIPVYAFPMGDGGDGTAQVLAHYFHAQPVFLFSCDALNRKNRTFYFRLSDTAIIGLADICGLKLLNPGEYDILNTNTRGVGIAIHHALQQGIQKIILCAGGSASVDGGTGALEELGFTFVNSGTAGNNHLIGIEKVIPGKLTHKLKQIEFTVLCDVENPLCGSRGAASVFGPQKGASPQQVEILDKALTRFAHLLSSSNGENICRQKHGGTAGGIAAAFSALFNARLISGAEFCLQQSGFYSLLNSRSLVITGEGCLDPQSAYGKIPGVIALKCREKEAPAIAVTGYTENPPDLFTQIFCLSDYAPSLTDSVLHPQPYLRIIAEKIKKQYT